MQPRDVLIQRAIQRLEAAVIALPENTRIKPQSEVQLAPNPPQTTPAKVIGPATTTLSQSHKPRLFGFLSRRQQRIGAA